MDEAQDDKSLLPFERMSRQVMVKRKAETSPKYGKRPEDRTMEEHLDLGIINIDKPKGPTSHQVSAYVQKILGIKKGGHSGTLDPKVTGVLPVAISRATRIVQALLPAGKEYICLMHLHKELPETQVREVLASFVGKIKQLPPIKSAVKREWRFRRIYYIEFMDMEGQEVLFRVGCQAGTYIRKLCHDMGEKLGCGAHMAELRRTKAGPFREDTSVTLHDLTDAFWYYKNEHNETYLRKIVHPIEAAVQHLPRIWVTDTAVNALCHGANLAVPGITSVESDIQVDEMIAVFSLKEELVAFGTVKMTSREILKKEKGVAVIINKVFMQPDVYPRMQKKE
jgi:H/ACA ribonucleoprotein complex subunit 4